jgi:hypothetical protein
MDLHPVVFAGYDRINRLVSLEESQGSESVISEDYSLKKECEQK